MDHDFVYDNTESQRGVSNCVITFRNSNNWLHNTQGPAVIWPDGQVLWALNGAWYTFEEWCDQVGIDEKRRLLLKIKYPNT